MGELIADIADASRQQASGLSQINTAMSELDIVTQQNAAMVEQATAAARSLAGEAADMTVQVSRFRHDDGRLSPAGQPMWAPARRAA
jgi:methyl-accepting chemotaxis protein